MKQDKVIMKLFEDMEVFTSKPSTRLEKRIRRNGRKICDNYIECKECPLYNSSDVMNCEIHNNGIEIFE